MRTTVMLIAIIAFSTAAPAIASAATSCADAYDKCLNDTWNTSGFSRILADAECGIRYYSCIRKALA